MKPNNPFVTRGYRGPEYFCDRVAETGKIVSALTNERNVTLMAPRRYGKTGLVHNVFNSLPSDYATVYIDIYATSNLQDFTQMFANAVLGALEAAAREGDYFRAKEMRFICQETIKTVPDASRQWWLMTGDFNAISSIDNYHYRLPADDPAFLVHDYVRAHTPYIDVIERLYPGEFQKSTLSGRRIDMVYLTPALYEKVTSGRILYEGFAESWRDPRGKDIHNFCHPSDHYPVLVTFRLK